MARPALDPAEMVDFDLDDDARRILRRGLNEWGGPARCTEEMAAAMGFASVVDLFSEGDRIGDAIRDHRPLARYDWARALLATEIVFASDYLGAGVDWSIVTGFSDVDTVDALRRIQRVLNRSQLPLIGTAPTNTPRALSDARRASHPSDERGSTGH